MSSLGELSALCAQARETQRDIDRIEASLKAAKEQLRALVEEDIPQLMSELELKRVVLETGEAITVALEVYASIPKARAQEALDWLRAHGHGGLIRTELGLAFGRDEVARADALAQELAERGFESTIAQNVHSGTLKAFLKEQLGSGVAVPLELFGARPVMTAKIKQP